MHFLSLQRLYSHCPYKHPLLRLQYPNHYLTGSGFRPGLILSHRPVYLYKPVRLYPCNRPAGQFRLSALIPRLSEAVLKNFHSGLNSRFPQEGISWKNRSRCLFTASAGCKSCHGKCHQQSHPFFSCLFQVFVPPLINDVPL